MIWLLIYLIVCAIAMSIGWTTCVVREYKELKDTPITILDWIGFVAMITAIWVFLTATSSIWIPLMIYCWIEEKWTKRNDW